MMVLIIGGTPAHRGGVEAFCERAVEALGRVSGWTVEHQPSESAYLRPRGLPGYFGGLASLVRARLRRSPPDCVWLQYVNLPDLGYLVVARVLGLPVLVTPHLGSNWRSQSVPALRRLSRWLLGFAQRIALLSGTQVEEVDFPGHVPRSMIRTFLPRALLDAPMRRRSVPASAPTRRDLLLVEAGPGMQADAVATTECDEAAAPLRLLHSARLSADKGSFLFVEVCRRLAEAGVLFEARMTGATDADTAARLRAAIDEAGLGGRLRWDGRADLDEQIVRLAEADVLVHLSVVDSYPLIVLEALAFGVFPVCVDLAGARDMVGAHIGATVPIDEAVSRTVEIIEGLDLPALRAAAPGVAARVRADYDWRCCVDRLVPAISATASRSKRGCSS